MLQSEKDALHYSVIANTAYKIEKVSKKLENLNRDSFINNKEVALNKKHLCKYFDELQKLLQ